MDTDKPYKYTFLLTAYRSAYLTDAIDSILSQTLDDFALIIVNDASPDDIDSIVLSYDDPRISYYCHTENCGGKSLAAHWNNCLAYVHTDYVILASDDDMYEPRFLAEIDRLFSKYPNVDVISARAKFIDRNGAVTHTVPRLPEYMSPIQYADAYCNGLIISSMQDHVFRHESLSRIGGFMEFPLAWHSDDATVMALSFGGVAFTQDTLFTFRNSGYNISSAKPDQRSCSLKFEARNQFCTWLKKTYMPKLSASAMDINDRAVVHALPARLNDKLRSLSLSMIYQANTSTALTLRSAFLKQQFVTTSDYYSAIWRKLWRNNRFLFSPHIWKKFITKHLR